MTHESKTICDNCAKEIGFTNFEYEYYLTLSTTQCKKKSGFSYACGNEPDFYGDKHFCGPGCLKKWINDHG